MKAAAATSQPAVPDELRCLVTGGSGFVGGHLVRRLLREEWVVHLLGRERTAWNLPNAGPGRLYVHRHDGTTASLVKIVAEARPRIAFHLATCFCGEHIPEQVAELVDSNVRFGAQLLEALARSNVRSLVNTGTVWQHRHVGRSEAYSPVNLYAATKQAFEAIVEFYGQSAGLRAITLKLGDTYGPGDPRPKLWPRLLRSSREGTPLDLSPGYQVIDLVHVDDVVSALLVAAERLRGLPPGGGGRHDRYKVTGGNPLSLREMVAIWEQATGVAPRVRWGARPYREREVMTGWEGGESLPGWFPQVDLVAGFRALAESNCPPEERAS